MKKIITLFVVVLMAGQLMAQETTKPLTDTVIERSMSRMDIEGKIYKNVKVTLQSISPDYYFTSYYKVKVTIVDMYGRIVWKKTLKNVYLYVFSDGQIQVGKPNFSKILINENYSGSQSGKIRVKEGIF